MHDLLPVCTQALEYLKQTGHVNTYTFTKCLTEQAIAEFHNNRSFAVAIVRPSIVVSPSFSAPSPSCSHRAIPGQGTPLCACSLMLPSSNSRTGHSCCSFLYCDVGTWGSKEVVASETGISVEVFWLQGAIAKHPYPGYFGNSAGPTAYFLAYGSGVQPSSRIRDALP